MKKQNIILIGFMGAGKTSVGNKLARRCHSSFIDTDQRIERKAGMTISKLFETQGEERFRQLETEVLEELLEGARGKVISVGGGLPLREENRKVLKKLGTVVYLQVNSKTVLKRLAGDTTRPLLQGEDVVARVESLLSFRGPIYTQVAHQVVQVDERTLDEIADEIIQSIEKGVD